MVDFEAVERKIFCFTFSPRFECFSMTSQVPKRYRFGVFQLDLASGELYKHGIRVKLQDQPVRVLALLLEKPGTMVSRDELRDRLWDHDTYVDFDHSLNISINKLRDVLGDSASNPRFIETLPRRGYRFLAPVSEEAMAPSAAASPVSVPASEPAGTALKSGPPPDVPPQKAAPVDQPRSGRVRIFIALAVVVVIAAASIFFWKITEKDRRADPNARIMLAVLPFENLTGDGSQDYFVAGLNDEMIAQLGRLHPSKLGVIARTSVVQYGASRKSVTEIGRELNVEYLLAGAVRRMGDRFRITAELVQVKDQTHLWTETYESQLNDLLRLQEDVARHVSQSLTVEFLPEAQDQLRKTSTANAGAYEAYLKGRYLWYQETRISLEEAIQQFNHAIELDPNYAPAYVGLADAYNVMGGYGFVAPDQAFPKGKAAAAHALELAPNLSDGYNSMAFASFYYDWDWDAAGKYFSKALALNPNNEVAHEFYASFLHAMGRMDEAEAENKIAKELAPGSAWLYDDMGWILLSRRRPDAAIAEFEKATELNTKFPAAYLSLAVAYTRTRQFDRAMAEVHKAEEKGGDPSRVLEVLGSLQAASGDTAGAEATVNKLLRGEIQGRVSPYSIALIYNALGKRKEALDWLEKAYTEKDTWVVWIGVLTEWQNLRGEPRFDDILRRLRLLGPSSKSSR
jgi:TolB-like protein/DNA-binding winged helix-turn-helix (wHTH) protein/Tfp pilus assembly protein PilF